MSESVDYGDTDLRSIIEGDRPFNRDEVESFGDFGYQQKEIKGEEIVDVEDDFEEEEELFDLEDSMDDEASDEE